MKIAYLLLVHKNADQVNRLIDRLADGDNGIFIHVDKKSDIHKDINKLPNTHFVKHRIKGEWGGYSLIEATMALFDLALACSENYDYYILLSGQDYPLKSNAFIKKFLIQNRGKEFFKIREMPYHHWVKQRGGFDRIEIYYPKWILGNTRKKWIIRNLYVQLCKALGFLKKRQFFKKYYGISQWFAISRNAVEYIYKYSQENVDALKFFKNSLIPDEIFFSTIIMNSHFKDKVEPTDLKLVDWTTGPEMPLIWKEEHISRIINSEALFARKFDMDIDSKVLDQIDKELLGVCC
ncbi:putative N-acetylglucosaminyltransferase [Owenweeksia hongkongensis DSM 17368]|uniref:Peptide O-xylosyltransferase n=1 Tax=Owenweeksia hongkongensis (strain DSM 17368 / CIP 108786 / JCM 12287 / NRRL B-23963 / UST20020801) TaxID=926562 RepID=G8R512_OWEHD|nr:N-acetylglucosaminyltransferase [Owenweeksia hongkongensis]AEV34326.1 putative N-acetylglucosaminyltransferase [Owenweeksia hongkongensis DSM 17368]